MAACAAVPKPNEADAYLSAREQYDSITARLRSDQAQRMTHSELEEMIEAEGRELLRRLLHAHLEERGPGEVTEPVVDQAGDTHTHQRVHSRSIKTIFGLVKVTRAGYGGRGLASLHPLDGELNLGPE